MRRLEFQCIMVARKGLLGLYVMVPRKGLLGLYVMVARKGLLGLYVMVARKGLALQVMFARKYILQFKSTNTNHAKNNHIIYVL